MTLFYRQYMGHDTYLYTEVLDTRPIVKENFNPMCWHLLDYENDCQVLINSIGGPNWISCHKSDLQQEKPKP